MGNNLDTQSFLNHSADKIDVKHTIYHLEQYATSEQLAESILDHFKSNTELFTFIDAYTRDMMIRLVHKIYVEDTEEVVKVPKTWWDMLRASHFPKWVNAKFPPRFVEKHIATKTFLIDGEKVTFPNRRVVSYDSLPPFGSFRG